MADRLRILYLDDCVLDHRLMSAYLDLDPRHVYDMTVCTSLEEASSEMKQSRYDGLVLDNRVPPHTSYHSMYQHLKESAGFDGPTVIVSADIDGKEFHEAARQDREVVVDKALLLDCIRNGAFAAIMDSDSPRA